MVIRPYQGNNKRILSGEKFLLFLRCHHNMLRNQFMFSDVNEQLWLQELFQDVFWCHIYEGLKWTNFQSLNPLLTETKSSKNEKKKPTCLADGVIPCCTTMMALVIFSSCILWQYVLMFLIPILGSSGKKTNIWSINEEWGQKHWIIKKSCSILSILYLQMIQLTCWIVIVGNKQDQITSSWSPLTAEKQW